MEVAEPSERSKLAGLKVPAIDDSKTTPTHG